MNSEVPAGFNVRDLWERFSFNGEPFNYCL